MTTPSNSTSSDRQGGVATTPNTTSTATHDYDEFLIKVANEADASSIATFDSSPPACDSSTTSSTNSNGTKEEEGSTHSNGSIQDSSTASSKEELDHLETLVSHHHNYINIPREGGEIPSDEEDQDSHLLFSSIPPPPRASLVRVLSSCSVGSESPSCPICLDPMTPIDHQHPLQCPTRHCHYNFCVSCINALLSSSKDDYETASDGNAHVKIYLNCPNCRSDLSTTIREVLLLRKVDTVIWLLNKRRPGGGYHSGSNCSHDASQSARLNPSQQRTHQAMQELHVQEAIQCARDKEKKFWKTHHRDLDDILPTLDDSAHAFDDSSTFFGSRRLSSKLISFRAAKSLDAEDFGCGEGSGEDEEWGVEADLEYGVHSSIRLPPGQALFSSASPSTSTGSCSTSYNHHKKQGCSTSDKNKKPKIDETLLNGLESCMTHAEQLQITHLMTNGDPQQLAKAADLLRKIENDAREGILPSHRQAQMNRRGSVYEIVDEARQLQQRQKDKSSNQQAVAASYGLPPTGGGGTGLPRQRQHQQLRQAAERRQFELSLMERQSVLERCPLPVRMPKAITIDLYYDPGGRLFPLRFCDDHWDGTVLDAYTRLIIAPAGRRMAANDGNPWLVTKKAQTQHAGVFHVLSQGRYQHHYGSVELTMDQPPRVLVASVQGAAGRQGVMKGDVVTHVDGHPLMDDIDYGRTNKAHTVSTAETLIAMLQAKQNAGQKTVDLVLNAEASVAEALKRRALVMD